MILLHISIYIMFFILYYFKKIIPSYNINHNHYQILINKYNIFIFQIPRLLIIYDLIIDFHRFDESFHYILIYSFFFILP